MSSVAYPKNEAQFKYSINNKVMFQVYYYSTAIQYCNANIVNHLVAGRTESWYWSSVYTDLRASVKYFPNFDADQEDPLSPTSDIMTEDLDFKSAIRELFDSALESSSVEDSSIRHFNIEVFN